jgi:hypothetical protein
MTSAIRNTYWAKSFFIRVLKFSDFIFFIKAISSAVKSKNSLQKQFKFELIK